MTKLLKRSDLEISASERSKLDALQRAALDDPELLEEAEALSTRYRDDQARSLASKLGITKDEALARIPHTGPSDSKKSTFTLDPFDLVWIKGQLLTVAELVMRGEEFDGCAMADPIEGPRYGTSTAMFYWNNGNPCIHSWAHGISTTFLLDGVSVVYVRENATPTPLWTAIQNESPKPLDLDTPLATSDFPHLKGPPNNPVPKATLQNYEALLAGYGINLRYNVIGKRVECNIPGFQSSIDNHDEAVLTMIESLAALNGLSVDRCKSMMGLIADQNLHNPIADWIDSRPWDGIDRLQALYATLTARDGYPEELKCTLMYRWLLSIVAAVLKPSGFYCRGVLTLLGLQGIGKTSWILRLISDALLREQYILDAHHLDPANKDSVLTAIRHVIVELGELDSSFKKDIARLKGFLTSKFDKIRKPYGKADSNFPRRTVFAASVNEENFLIDPTGNSRWWVIPVVQIDYQHEIDMQQVFAQLAVDFHNGEQWWLTPEEEAVLTEQNRGFEAVSVVEEAVLGALDLTLPEDQWQRLTASGVLQQVGFDRPTNAQARECGTVLRRRFGNPTKIQGSTKWLVPIPSSSFPTQR